jgi:hypothetical protein
LLPITVQFFTEKATFLWQSGGLMPVIEEQEYIFRPYITVKGRRITRPNGGMFKIPVKDKKPETRDVVA